MKCIFIDEHRDQWPVRLMGEVLGLSTAAYYAWRDRPVSARRQRRVELHQKIVTIHQQVKVAMVAPASMPSCSIKGKHAVGIRLRTS
jgi:putative transposase